MRLSDKLFKTLNEHTYETYGSDLKEPTLSVVLEIMVEVNDFYSTWTDESKEFIERLKEENK